MFRHTDPVTFEQRLEAMAARGASRLFDPPHPHLHFATLDEAERRRDRLAERRPVCREVWSIGRDLVPVEAA